MIQASTIIGITSIISLALAMLGNNGYLFVFSLILGVIGIPLGIVSAFKGKSTGLVLSFVSLFAIAIFMFLYVAAGNSLY